jgi:hypothetical protein
VLPLPNLETKFVAANTLIGVKKKKKGDQLLLIPDEIKEKQSKLLEKRHQYFNTHNAKDKKNIREEDKILTKELSSLLEEVGFLDHAYASMLAKWDPYCQTEHSDFFDANWMFGIINGFFVVIGNPPYIQLQNNHGELANKYQNCNFDTFTRTGDIYQLFYEKGISLLCNDGILCYITSNKWMRAGYGEETRKYFSENIQTLQLVDFAGNKVFESATVDVSITVIRKNNTPKETMACTIKEKSLINLTDYVNQYATHIQFSYANSWVILSPIEQRIKEKIEKVGIPLKDWDISIN